MISMTKGKDNKQSQTTVRLITMGYNFIKLIIIYQTMADNLPQYITQNTSITTLLQVPQLS